MYVSRRRNLRHGGGILLSVEAMNIDAVHPIGSLLFSMDAYYDPNNDENMQNTTWELLNYDDYAISSTNIPILAGMVSGDNSVHGAISWENLPKTQIHVSGLTNTNDNSVKIRSSGTFTSNPQDNPNTVYSLAPNDPYIVGGRNTQVEGFYEQATTDLPSYDAYKNTHKHSFTATGELGGYTDDEEEDHDEGKTVNLLANPKTIRAMIWKRIA